MKSSIVLISNPAAKNASVGKIKKAGTILRNKGFDVTSFLTCKRGDAENLAARAAGEGHCRIIAGGGDGTINEVLNGVAGSDVPVAFLPLGTTNVLAKELGIREDIEGALETAVNGRTRRVSLGRIETASWPSGRYFCLMAGIGLDGRAVRDVSSAIKKISGKGAYLLSGIKNICTYSQEELLLRLDGDELSGYGAIVCKSSKYGGQFVVAPEASLENDYFYTCIFKGRRRRDLVRYAVGVLTGRHLRYRDVAYMRSSEVTIAGQAPIQIDGDYLGMSPARLTVVKDIVNLVY